MTGREALDISFVFCQEFKIEGVGGRQFSAFLDGH